MSEHQESGAAGHTVTQPSSFINEDEPGASGGGRAGQRVRGPAGRGAGQGVGVALPSFGKQLFLGDFQLGLIQPASRARPPRRAGAARSSARGCASSARPSVNGALIERDARIPDETVKGLAGLGRVRHEDLAGVRRARPHQPVLQPGADDRRVGLARDGRAAVGAPVDRRAAAAGAVRHRRAEAALPAPVRPRRDQRVPADRAGRRLRPGAAGHHGDAVRRRQRVRAERRQAVDHQRRGRRPARGDGAGAEGRGAPRRHHRVRGGGQRGRDHRRAPQRVHGPARAGERRDQVPRGPGAGGRPDRRGGPGPEDRPYHPEHRPALAARPAARRPGSWRVKIAREWSGERVQWGRPIGEHEAVAKKIAFIAATGLRARGRSSSCPASWPTTSGSDIRIEAALAKLYCSEMAWQDRGRAGADPRRARLRDGGVAGRARRARRARRADAARHADQPDLRGLLGDHAPVHRPGGGGRAPGGGRRGDRAGPAGGRNGPARRPRPAGSTPGGCPRW